MDFDFDVPVTDLAKVPEQFRPLYVTAQDGKIGIDVADPKVKGAVEAISGFNKALKAARAEAKANKSKTIDLAPLAEYGDSPETILSRFNEMNGELQEQLKAAGKVDTGKIKQDLAKQFTGEIDKHKLRSTALQNQLYGMLVDNAALTAVTEMKGTPELLMPLISKSVKVTEVDGKFVVQVVDAAGDVRYSGTTGNPMTIKELVASMKADDKYSRAFDSEHQNGGGGADANGSRQQVRTQVKVSDMTPMQKIAAGLTKGQASRR